ncbi:hypothetical protein [Nitrosospira multiformis]|uniref:hypothetical protein n=1 Tax=Nitrosospira multiformis TaxID=1231 RepID=UPI00089A4FC1|nr:hypothetical protein [Nitrosospira multiformis]SDZ79156.1 hypothetical protein SAMN05216411_101420 [Nitrosospira multiformis]
MALREVGRPLRLANVILAPRVIPPPSVDRLHQTGSGSQRHGVLLILLALPVGPIRSHYGAGERWNSIRAVGVIDKAKPVPE